MRALPAFVLLVAACSGSKPMPVPPVASAPIASDAGTAPGEDHGTGRTDPAKSSKETRVVAKTLDLMS
jgi:hypothetical protein